jgi:CBS domain-containing protein
MAKSVRDAMTLSPQSIGTSDSVVKAAQLMRDEDIGSLPVVEDGRLVGMITDRDITVRVVAESAEPESIQVRDVASRDAVMVALQQDLDEALRLMAHHQVRRLPVTDGDRLVGILAQADVAHDEERERVGELVEAISDPSEAERRV